MHAPSTDNSSTNSTPSSPSSIAIGSCIICNATGPVGSICNQCEDQGAIYDNTSLPRDSLPSPKIYSSCYFDKSKLENIHLPSTFANARPWFAAIPPKS